MKFNSIIFPFLFLLISTTIKAQDLNNVFFEIDAVTKISVGDPKRDQINYQPNLTVDVPKVSNYNNPICGLNFSFNYKFKFFDRYRLWYKLRL